MTLHWKSLVFLGLLTFLPFEGKAGVLDSLLGTGSTNWTVQEETDKLSDEKTIGAQKVYPLETGHIEAHASCTEGGIIFDFNYFDDESKDESSYNFHDWFYGNVVDVSYRLDNDAVQNDQSKLLYKNQASIIFLTQEKANELQKQGNLTSATATDLINAKLLRVRLPLKTGTNADVSGSNADLEIHTAELKELFVNCPSTADLFKNGASREAVSTNSISKNETIPSFQKGGPCDPNNSRWVMFKRYNSDEVFQATYQSECSNTSSGKNDRKSETTHHEYPSQLEGILEPSDWPYVHERLINAYSLGEQAMPITWSNAQNGHQGIVFQSGEGADEKGCRQFRVSKVVDAMNSVTKYVDYCSDGSIH